MRAPTLSPLSLHSLKATSFLGSRHQVLFYSIGKWRPRRTQLLVATFQSTSSRLWNAVSNKMKHARPGLQVTRCDSLQFLLASCGARCVWTNGLSFGSNLATYHRNFSAKWAHIQLFLRCLLAPRVLKPYNFKIKTNGFIITAELKQPTVLRRRYEQSCFSFFLPFFNKNQSNDYHNTDDDDDPNTNSALVLLKNIFVLFIFLFGLPSSGATFLCPILIVTLKVLKILIFMNKKQQQLETNWLIFVCQNRNQSYSWI